MSGAEHPFPWSEDAICRPSAEDDVGVDPTETRIGEVAAFLRTHRGCCVRRGMAHELARALVIEGPCPIPPAAAEAEA